MRTENPTPTPYIGAFPLCILAIIRGVERLKANQQQIFDISGFGGNKSEARLSNTGCVERIAQAGMLEIDNICLRKQLRDCE